MTKVTVDNYKTLVGQIFDKTVAVSADIGAHPAVSEFTTVNYQADIK